MRGGRALLGELRGRRSARAPPHVGRRWLPAAPRLLIRAAAAAAAPLPRPRAGSGCPCFKSRVAAVQGLKKRFHLALPEPQVGWAGAVDAAADAGAGLGRAAGRCSRRLRGPRASAAPAPGLPPSPATHRSLCPPLPGHRGGAGPHLRLAGRLAHAAVRLVSGARGAARAAPCPRAVRAWPRGSPCLVASQARAPCACRPASAEGCRPARLPAATSVCSTASSRRRLCPAQSPAVACTSTSRAPLTHARRPLTRPPSETQHCSLSRFSPRVLRPPAAACLLLPSVHHAPNNQYAITSSMVPPVLYDPKFYMTDLGENASKRMAGLRKRGENVSKRMAGLRKSS